MREINQRIRFYRRKSEFTQNQLAEALGMKGSTYSQAEREGNVTCDLLLRVAAVLEVAPEILLLGEKPIETPPQPTKPPKQPEPIYTFTQKEINIMKIFRHASQENKNKIYEFLKELDKKER